MRLWNWFVFAVIGALTAFSIITVWPSEPDRYLPDFIPWPEGRGIEFSYPTIDGANIGLESIELGPSHRIVVVTSQGRLIGLLLDAVEQVAPIDRLKIEEPPEDVMTDRSYYIVGVFRREAELLILLDTDRVLQVRDVDEQAEGS